MPVLVVKDGPQADERIEVETELVLGREGADVVLDDSELSRRHLRVRPTDGAVEIEDLDSLNGTWVNGTRISRPVTLAPGDVVLLGTTVVELVPEPVRAAETRVGPGTTVAGPAL